MNYPMPLLTAGPGHRMQKGGKQLFVFDLHVLDDSQRKVSGIATGPQLDRENESVLKSAIEKALPNFMMLPVMHLDHTERPVGWFTKAEFRGQDLYVEACVKPTSDCDPFWEDVKKADREGKPYQFSIFGERTDCTDACRLDPSQRAEPCITKGLELYSISICHPGTAINPNTFAEVMKAMGIETPPEVATLQKDHYPWEQCIADRKKEGHSQESAEKICGAIRARSQGLGKATDSAMSVIHPTTDGKYPKEKSMDNEEMKKKPEEEVPHQEKADTNQQEAEGATQNPGPESGGDKFDKIVDLLETVVTRLQALEAGIGVNKAEPYEGKESPEEEEKEKEKGDPMAKSPCAKKAEQTAQKASEITKADLGRLSKAEERLAGLESRLNTIEKATRKGPDVLVVDPISVKKAEEAMEKEKSSISHLGAIYH